MGILFAQLRRLDWVLLISTFLLVCFGLVALYGIAVSQEVPDWGNLTKQIIALTLGLVAALVLALTNYRWFRTSARLLYVCGLALSASVLLFGQVIRGTRGWFTFGGFSFQPVEVVKIVVIIFLAWYFAQQPRPLNQMKFILISGAAVFVFFGLTVLQPDLGSALILFFLWLGLLAVIGLRPWQWLLFGAGIIIAVVMAWNFVLAPYQQSRLTIFLDPSADPLGAGYNVTQSMIAIGSGGLVGSGLSFGSQSQLKFLPEAHTDFVFAVIAQELGLIGVSLLLALFAVVFFRLLRIARRCPDDFGLFIIVGIMLLLFIQLIMNVGMNLGMAPVTGITLPFVSYGGSSLIVMLAAIGIAQSVHLQHR